MKKLFSLSVFLASVIILAASCGQKRPSTVIVKVENGAKEIRYWPLDWENYASWDNAGIVEVGGNNTVELTLPGDFDSYIVTSGKYITIHTSPNSVDTMYMYKDSTVFAGDNKAYNEVFAEYTRSTDRCFDFIVIGSKHEARQANELVDFKKIVERQKSADYDLLKNRNFSKKFIKQQQLYIDMWYYWLFLKKMGGLYMDGMLTDEWKAEIDYGMPDINDKAAPGAYPFIDILRDYSALNAIIKGKEMEYSNESIFNIFSEMLEEPNREYALAWIFHNDSESRSYDPDIPELFDRFLTIYPDSKYAGKHSPWIEEVRAYHNPEKNDGVIFLEYSKKPETFDDIIAPLAGKVIYVDLWATWCAPCIKNFDYIKNLKEKAKDLDIAYLYISLDDEDSEHDRWYRLVHKHNLEGYNYRTNPTVKAQIFIPFADGGSMMIPRHGIVDRNGKLVIRDASGPEDPDKVIEQIKQFL